MKLQDVLKKINYKEIYGSTSIEIKDISINSKKIKKGSLFTAIEGFKHDGHSFIEEAISGGAIGIVARKKTSTPSHVTQVIVNDTRKVLPLLSKNFYRDPTKLLKLIGVTGTNGKTTTCYLIDSILRSAGIKTSLITTVESFLNGEEVVFERTTPESIDLNVFFDKSRQEKVDAACMEVSSHSIDLHRIDYLKYNYFVFTNLSQDHLDYHKDMGRYFAAKKKLFLKVNRNIYGGEKAAFNIYNILAATGVCIDMGIKIKHIIEGINSMHGVKGRFEKVYADGKISVIIDYAHTPDGLKNALHTCRELLTPGGKIISVFGCGGDRDKGKRKIMGHISGQYADYTIITSDNPRSEEPVSIISMIEEGVIGSKNDRYAVEVDRRKAIFKALKMAGRNDIVIIAGKGHENCQEFKD